MAIVSGIKFQAKIGEVNELEEGLKEYVSLAKKVGSTMALIRAASGPAGVIWTLTLYETPGELDSTRECRNSFSGRCKTLEHSSRLYFGTTATSG